MGQVNFRISRAVVRSASAIAVCAGLAAGSVDVLALQVAGAAFADEHSEDEGGHSDGQKHGQEQGEGGQGARTGQDRQGEQGSGQGGPGEDSDGKGPQAGGPSDNSGGGKPVWAQEGIPEVELGRLSVARSPEHVLDRALAEALATFTPDMATFYNLGHDEMITELSLNWDDLSLIDSPLQNLALLEDALDGTTDLAQLGVTNDIDTLLSTFLGVASDKTVPITPDAVVAVTTILGTPVTGTDAEALAADAEAIRIAVLAGHG